MLGPDVGAFSQAALRSLLIVLVILPLVLRRKDLKRPTLGGDWKWILLMGGGALFSQSAYFIAVNRVGIGLGVTIMFTIYVLLLMIWGALYDKVPFTSANLISLLLAIAGLVLLCNPNGRVDIVGIGWSIVSGLAIAATIVGGKYMTGGPLYALLVGWGLCAITNGIIGLVLHEPLGVLITPSHALAVLAYTAASIAASFTLQSGVRQISAALTGLIGLLENVFAIIFGAVIFGERLGWLGLAGALIILVAIAVPDLQALMNKRRNHAIG